MPRGSGGLEPEERKAVGAEANRAKQVLEAAREERREAAGYTSLRIKPNSSINPRQFWAAVDEYMRPLPKQPPRNPLMLGLGADAFVLRSLRSVRASR